MNLLSFITWQFVLFSLGIIAILFVLRKVMEYIFPKIIDTKFWEQLVLPTAPIIFGGIIGLVLRRYPWDATATHMGERIIFGLVAGLLSGLIYKVVNGLLGNQIQNVVGSAANILGVKLPVAKNTSNPNNQP